MLICNADIWGCSESRELRIVNGQIAAIGTLSPLPDELILDARGGAILPGLHDHHIHLFALAASLESIVCGPPEIGDGNVLAATLRDAPGEGWVRGIGYHESVGGDIDRHWLDAAVADRPVRVQHRSGRLWILNSCGVDLLMRGGGHLPKGVERVGGIPSGRFYECDVWLRERLASPWPDLAPASALLASYGVTGLTEMTPSNDDTAADYLAQQQAEGSLRQSVLVAGKGTLSPRSGSALMVLATKFHLHESWLPDFDETRDHIRRSHAIDRPVAIHCVTRVELVFALAALQMAGVIAGDRIEHASIAPDELMDQVAALNLAVVGQPNFIAERGDSYRVSVAADDLPNLYRARSFIDRGIVFAGGTDAPFGRPDPWAAMRAAVARTTAEGVVMGASEVLSPEAALGLFLCDGRELAKQRTIGVGASADLCLLDRPWSVARKVLDGSMVRTTMRGGEVIHALRD